MSVGKQSVTVSNKTSSDDLNRIAAQHIKSLLTGNEELASKIKRKLDAARKLSVSQRDQLECPEPRSKRAKKQSQKCFNDESRYSLKQMFQDADKNQISEIFRKAKSKMDHHNEKDVVKAIYQHRKCSAALAKCNYCLDQPNIKQHLIVKKFKKVYLCIPEFQSLVEGHCLIVPTRHVQSLLALNEEEWHDIEDLKCSLRKLFHQQDKHIIILETSRGFKYFPHAYLEIIPVSEEISDMAPLYFKKAILESETEWTDNVKLLDLSKKDLRHSVPKNFPYFCVQFDPKVHAGYAHVIEDEKYFERNFGQEVVGGMLGMGCNYLFKNRTDPVKKSRETVEFIKMWQSFHKQ